MRLAILSVIILTLLLSACTPAIPTPAPSATALPPTALAPSQMPEASATPSATLTPLPTITRTPTVTLTPTITPTPSITPSPTFDFPDVAVNMQAHCRYGPSTAYLHAADLYSGDRGVVWGRFAHSGWLWVRFEKLWYPCWVAPSVVDVTGDLSLIRYTEPDLMKVGSNMYGPPQKVQATRNGDQVTITWKRVGMTEDDDRGYFIEAYVCQDGVYRWWTASLPDQYATSYTVQDEPGCKHASRGEIRSVEKHGYSEPAIIPWP
jgi:hypothetical protein